MKSIVIGAHLRRDDVEPLAAAIDVGDLTLSGIEVPDDQPLGDRELLLRVAGVRAQLLARATFVAIRYGVAVRGDADALAKVAAHLPRWRTLLEAHRDDVEMTLKVAASEHKPRPDRRDFSSGAAYLRALHEATNAAAIDGGFRAAVDARLGTLARAQRWQPRDNTSLEFAALVPRADVARVTDVGAELKREFPNVPFLLSGPWPLEVFAEEAER